MEKNFDGVVNNLNGFQFKMTARQKIIDVVFRAIEEVNQQLPRKQRLEKSIKTVLYGQSGELDSFGLVNIILATEQKIEEDFGIAISLADDEEISQDEFPFNTVETFADYISRLMEKKGNG